MRVLWNKRAVGIGPGKISLDKMPLFAAKVYKKCDGIDGLEDGHIEDPRNCPFDPARDLPGCEPERDDPDCFTRAQTAGLKKVYEGITTSSGETLFPGQPLGAEVLAPKSGWEGFIVGPMAGAMEGAESYLRHLFLDVPPGPDWTCLDLDFDADLAKMTKFEAIANATNPNLRPLKQKGGGIIQYHDWSDPAATVLMSTSYYESVLTEMGDRETKRILPPIHDAWNVSLPGRRWVQSG